MMKTSEAKDVALGKYVIGFASGQDVRDTFIRKHYHLELKSKLLLPQKYLLLTFTNWRNHIKHFPLILDLLHCKAYKSHNDFFFLKECFIGLLFFFCIFISKSILFQILYNLKHGWKLSYPTHLLLIPGYQWIAHGTLVGRGKNKRWIGNDRLKDNSLRGDSSYSLIIWLTWKMGLQFSSGCSHFLLCCSQGRTLSPKPGKTAEAAGESQHPGERGKFLSRGDEQAHRLPGDSADPCREPQCQHEGENALKEEEGKRRGSSFWEVEQNLDICRTSVKRPWHEPEGLFF